MTLAILLAAAAALAFAAGTSLQHRAASAGTSAAGLVRGLVRQPSWVIGLGLSGVAFCLHAAALREGSLTLVQPIVVSAVVFAVFIRAGLDRRLPGGTEVAWALATFGGLALFIATLRPSAAQHAAGGSSALIFLAISLAAAVVAVLWSRRVSTAARRGLLLGAAAGVLFGLIAGLIKVVVGLAQTGLLHVLDHWAPWALVGAGAGALLLNQRAYQAARLSVTMPILNIVDVVVALAFGVSVFGEQLFSSPLRLLLEVGGLLIIGVGVWQLARHQELGSATVRTRPSERADGTASPAPPARQP